MVYATVTAFVRRRRWRVPAAAFLLLLLPGTTVVAQEVDTRLALVIGNARYQHFDPLTNPVNDARDMANVLRRLGFQVAEHVDVSLIEMENAVFEFGRQLSRHGGVGLFFYAGHGVEVDGSNYLIPVDSNIRSEDEVRFRALAVDQVLAKMDSARNLTNVVILDACRDNPLPSPTVRGVGVGRGLSVVQAPAGSLVVYATAPGQAALDGEGRNGIFTAALLAHIEASGVDVETMLRDVRRDVMAATGGEQVPWSSSSLSAAFYFAPGTVPATGPTSAEAEDRGVITVSARADGQLSLDGQPMGLLAAGQTVTLRDVMTGRRELTMVYGEERERIVVNVRAGESASAWFQTRVENALSDVVRLEFSLVAAGTFRMGSDEGEEDEKPIHEVQIAPDFRIGTYEVTNAEYAAVMNEMADRGLVVLSNAAVRNATGNIKELLDLDSQFSRIGFNGERLYVEAGYDLYPVVEVTWYGAYAFAYYLNELAGGGQPYNLADWSCDFASPGFRLPTEAEWEYAARGGVQSGDFQYAGSDDPDAVAWYSDNSGFQTHLVGQKAPNTLGIYDMSGNVWEWCWDPYHQTYYQVSPRANPTGLLTDGLTHGPDPGTPAARVQRGGSMHYDADRLRVSNRTYNEPGFSYNNYGFRLVELLER